MKAGLFQKLFEVLYPRRCPGCGKVIAPDEIFCSSCKIQCREFSGVFCSGCHSMLRKERPYCGCGGIPCTVPYWYEGMVRRGIIQYKFCSKRQYGENFAQAMAEKIRPVYDTSRIDFITFVPMTGKAKRKRGYNQAEILAKDLSKYLEIPCLPVLEKFKGNEAQKELSARKRRENVKGVFQVVERYPVKNKTILLCDDIITTGATIQECARILYQAGAAEVLGTAVAHTKEFFS